MGGGGTAIIGGFPFSTGNHTWRSCIQSVITTFSVKTRRISNVYVSSAPISLVMVSPFALAFIMFKKLVQYVNTAT